MTRGAETSVPGSVKLPGVYIEEVWNAGAAVWGSRTLRGRDERAETTTPNDIDGGIMNIVIGFAPVKPAEFVIIKIAQKAGAGV